MFPIRVQLIFVSTKTYFYIITLISSPLDALISCVKKAEKLAQ